MIGIIGAMDEEVNKLKEVLEGAEVTTVAGMNFVKGLLEGKDVVIVRSGIGKVNAACTCVEMIKNFVPDVIINTGLAGGIDKSLSVMDIVVADKTTYHDVWCGDGCKIGQIQDLPEFFEGSKKLVDIAKNINTDVKIHTGLIAGGDVFVTDIAKLKEIKQNFPSALAVDMESTAIAQVCYLYNVPALAVRIISDTPGIENHYNQYLDFWNKAPEKSLEVIKSLVLANN